jgi:hypothetical protein
MNRAIPLNGTQGTWTLPLAAGSVAAAILCFGCGGGSGSDTEPSDTGSRGDNWNPECTEVVCPDTDPNLPDATADLPSDAAPEAVDGIPPDAPDVPPESLEDGSGGNDTGTDAPTDASPHVDLPEQIVDAPGSGCDTCFLAVNETWDGVEEPGFPKEADYTSVYEGQTFFLRPYSRIRMPHPGKVARLYVLTSGAGKIEMRLSSGFPGGHYPCLDENSGEDKYPVGPAFVMETTAEQGWRVFDVSAADYSALGYDELFAIFRQEGDARVGLFSPVPQMPGDYSDYGGLIADAPADGMECFPTMSVFEGTMGGTMAWVIRAEIEASEVIDDKGFLDEGAAGLNVGGHAAFGDYDNDGDDDLLSNGTLWRNDGTGTFENVTEEALLAGLGGETVWGDYDNDGWRDILGVGGAPSLFHNEGDGTFTNVTADSGISIDASSQGVSWLDVDADGFLDFYAASYGTLADSEIPTRDFLFINKGDGTFYDFTETAGIPVSGTKLYHGRGVCVADYDQDGDQDVYVGNYRLDPNQLWQNQGGLAGFIDVAYNAGVKGFFQLGGWGHTIGPSFGDLDGNGLIDLVVPNLAHPRFFYFSDKTTVYLNKGDGTFSAAEAPAAGILYDETHSDSVLFDADNDSDLDVFLTSVYEGRRAYLYANDGTGKFTDVTYAAGILQFNGWGAAAADVDDDGDEDLVAYRLFRNQADNGNHFLRIKLTGAATPGGPTGLSNRDAIGAAVVVTAGGKTLFRQVEGGTGVGCQNSATLHFGLGSTDTVDSVKVLWPSGKTSEHPGLAVDKTHILEEKTE